MNRISTTQSYSALLAGLQTAQARQSQAQQQVSTGKLGNDLKAYAAHADTLTATRSVAARTAAYIDSGQAIADRLSAQDLALGQLTSAADTARQAIMTALAQGDASGLMTAMQGALGQAAGALNTEFDGRRLFGGGNDQTPPVSAQSLSDLTAAPSVASVFRNDARAEVSRLDDQTTLKTGVLASDVGQPLLQSFADLQTFSQGPGGPFSGKLTAAQESYLQGALAGFTAAHSGAVEATAANGAVQTRVDASMGGLRARDVQLKGVLGGLTDVDLGEAATRLQLAQVAVQASAQVFQTLQGSSLLNVLRN